MSKLLDEMEAQLKRARKSGPKLGPAFDIKINERGIIGVYGLGRFPVNLYKNQWLKLLDHAEDIRAFIAALPEEE